MHVTPGRLTLGSLLLASCILADSARAQSEQTALNLADKAPVTTDTRSYWQASFETAVGNYNAASQTGSIDVNDTVRESVSFAYDRAFTQDWRLQFSDRLDSGWRESTGHYSNINTLKQAFVSWQPARAWVFDAGRINQREGVASGFNPTDFFKANALRSVVSIDPASLRENRLGSVMLRGQALWNGGALTTLISPRLGGSPNTTTFSPDFAATNQQTRYLITATQRVVGDFAPQLLIYGGTNVDSQIGINLTTLVNDSSVAFLEYAGGRLTPIANATDDGSAARHFYSKLATGFTHTFPGNVSATLEYDYDGASADRTTWDHLAQNPAQFGSYRSNAAAAQELATRHSIFGYAKWQNALVQHLGFTAMARYSLVEHSYFTWLEARYQWPKMEVALQWQNNYGPSHSVYGDESQKHVVQALLLLYF